MNNLLLKACIYISMAKTIGSRVNTISASVYTQTTDVELECDGFLNYDRSNKFDDAYTKAIHDANRALTTAGGIPSRATSAIDSILKNMGCNTTEQELLVPAFDCRASEPG